MSTSHDSHSDPTQYDGLGHHIASLQTYIAVFGSLLFFTALTYAVSFADLGSFALLIAMMVAGVKAFLVGTFFMHLKYDEKFNVLVFLSSIFFVAVFFGFTLMDLGSRAVITETEDYHTWWDENPDARPIAFGRAPIVEAVEVTDAAAEQPADGSQVAPQGGGNAPVAVLPVIAPDAAPPTEALAPVVDPAMVAVPAVAAEPAAVAPTAPAVEASGASTGVGTGAAPAEASAAPAAVGQ